MNIIDENVLSLAGNIGNVSLCVKEILGHKIWDSVRMTLGKVFGTILSVEASPHRSVCSEAGKAN